MLDNKEGLLEIVRMYHIRRIETFNQTILTLKCKRGCSWKLTARLNSYSSSWHNITYHGKHGSFVLGSDNVLAVLIHLTSSVILQCD